MTRDEVRTWGRVRRLGQRLRWRFRSWLRRAGRFFRRLPAWLPDGTERREVDGLEIRILGPLPAPPEIDDQDVMERLRAMAPDAGKEQLQSWLAGLTAHRDRGREVFPLDESLSELPLARTSSSHWLHRLTLDRRPSSSYLEARFGAPAGGAQEPAELLLEGRPVKSPRPGGPPGPSADPT